MIFFERHRIWKTNWQIRNEPKVPIFEAVFTITKSSVMSDIVDCEGQRMIDCSFRTIKFQFIVLGG